MPEPVLHQLSAFALFILDGMALGLAFDLLAAYRRILRPRGLGSILLDILYWLAALAFTFHLLLVGTRGEPRHFFWLALGVGLIYYRRFLRAPGRRLAWHLTQLFPAVLRFASRSRRGGRVLRVDAGLAPRPPRRNSRKTEPR